MKTAKQLVNDLRRVFQAVENLENYKKLTSSQVKRLKTLEDKESQIIADIQCITGLNNLPSSDIELIRCKFIELGITDMGMCWVLGDGSWA